jgi:hypothetical protein
MNRHRTDTKLIRERLDQHPIRPLTPDITNLCPCELGLLVVFSTDKPFGMYPRRIPISCRSATLTTAVLHVLKMSALTEMFRCAATWRIALMKNFEVWPRVSMLQGVCNSVWVKVKRLAAAANTESPIIPSIGIDVVQPAIAIRPVSRCLVDTAPKARYLALSQLRDWFRYYSGHVMPLIGTVFVRHATMLLASR